MKRGFGMERVFMGMELPGEIPPGMSLVEIVGNSRVLIENQVGVCRYDRSNITVKVRQGLVCVSGENLELRMMSKNQLVITGVVFSVSLSEWR